MITSRKRFTLIRVLIGICLLVSLLALQGCTNKNVKLPDIVNIDQIFEQTPKTVNKAFTNEDKELFINADIILPGNRRMGNITLIRDEESTKRMAEELVLLQFKNVEHPSDWSWSVLRDGSLLAAFSVDTDNWSAYYLDVESDLSGQYYEEECLLQYDHITQLKPVGLEMTSVEAAKVVCDYFGNFSELDFRPYRVLSADSTNNPGQGFYTVWAQAVCDGIPVCPRMDKSPVGLGVYAWISGEKIFSFQSKFLFKLDGKEDVSALVSLSSVIEQLERSFAYFIDAERVDVNKIALEYYTLQNPNGTYQLRPVWSFYGESEADGYSAPMDHLFSYFADDGTLCYAGLLFY